MRIHTHAVHYDPHGRRLRKAAGGALSQYLYDGLALHAEYGATWSQASAAYTHGPGLDAPLLRTSATATHYYHADGLGSVVALSDRSGALTAHQRFDAWGNRLAGSGVVPQYGYAGREPDATGLGVLPRTLLRPEPRALHPAQTRSGSPAG